MPRLSPSGVSVLGSVPVGEMTSCDCSLRRVFAAVHSRVRRLSAVAVWGSRVEARISVEGISTWVTVASGYLVSLVARFAVPLLSRSGSRTVRITLSESGFVSLVRAEVSLGLGYSESGFESAVSRSASGVPRIAGVSSWSAREVSVVVAVAVRDSLLISVRSVVVASLVSVWVSDLVPIPAELVRSSLPDSVGSVLPLLPWFSVRVSWVSVRAAAPLLSQSRTLGWDPRSVGELLAVGGGSMARGDRVSRCLVPAVLLAFRPRSRGFPGSVLVLRWVREIPVVMSSTARCSVLAMAQVRAPSAVLSTVSVSVVDWMRAGVFTAVVSWARVSVRTSLGVPLYSAEQSPLEAELLVTLSWEIAVQSASEGVLLWDTFPVVVAVLSVPDSAQATLLSAEPSAVFISVVIGTGVGVLARITFTVVRGESLCSVVLLFWAAFLCLVRSCLVAVLPASPSLA